MVSTNRARLSMMMALIYAVQGAWWPLLALHLRDLGLSGRQRGLIFATYPFAAILTSIGAGSVVDRLMPSQRYLFYCFGAGSVLLLGVAAGEIAAFPVLMPIFLAYWLITAPTYGIANTIALRNLGRPHLEFGRVRMWGTVGWMAVGWTVTATMIVLGSSRSGRGSFEGFWLASALSATLALFAARALPDTPPLAIDARSTSLAASIRLVRDPAVAVYLVVAFGVSLTTPFVYQTMPTHLESIGLPRAWTATVMTLGQWPEIAALAGLPWLLRRLGYKATLGLGLTAWLVRYGSLAAGPPLWAAVAGIPLHGIGIACFTVGGQVFLDGRAPAERRAGAQATHAVVTSGLGSLAGSLLAGDLLTRFRGDYPSVFLVPCLILTGLLGWFLTRFRPDAGRSVLVEPADRTPRPSPRGEAILAPSGLGPFAMESADG